MGENIVNSVGELLKAARESRSLTLDVVNQETKISVDVLNALEQDDFDSIGSDIYVKGFIRNYARYLGVDVEQVLRTLDRQRGGGTLGRGTVWDIEETITEEKLRSPRIFRRFVVPLLFILILVLFLLFVNERRKVKRLTPDNAQGYLQGETVDSRRA